MTLLVLLLLLAACGCAWRQQLLWTHHWTFLPPQVLSLHWCERPLWPQLQVKARVGSLKAGISLAAEVGGLLHRYGSARTYRASSGEILMEQFPSTVPARGHFETPNDGAGPTSDWRLKIPCCLSAAEDARQNDPPGVSQPKHPPPLVRTAMCTT